ncbi:DUF2304 domain-containing protein [Oerskovia sp. Sa1BUA8]|uniref:DUF2304 domain-containing protein n=1 Tax=Oerskovia douganii TaxID=2762210 RepID=A0A9D5UAU0_9CELL|nr:DUF2304 domain-containing protein [Oerskovia douganii]MBE7699561.1 DUF2304 domain-containing protein [Oerskovia douganii]
MLIQVILLAAIAVVAVLLTRSTADARHQAIRRLLLAGFVVASVAAIVFPQALSYLANLIGVGRGTDLLLYALVIAFVSYIATSHRRANQLSRKITLLTRELSLAEARIESVAKPEDTPPPAA